MKNGWPVEALGDVADVIAGQSPEGSYYNTTGDGLPFYQGKKDFGERFIGRPTTWTSQTTKVALEGDVLMSVRAPVGPVNFATEKSCIGRGLAAIRSGSDLDDNFLFYFLRSKQDEISGTEGAVFASISKTQIQKIKIGLPPLAEQQRIVGILDDAFAGIATAKANAEKNLQNARALFKSHLQSVFTQRGDRRMVSIGEVAEVFDGPHATPRTVDVGPVFLGISALQDGKINLGETRHVTPADFRQWTRRVKPQTDDVVFSYETRLGQAAIIPDGLECCLGRRMGLVRVDRTRVDPRFFVWQYISPPFREFLDSRTVRGTTVDRIALKEFPSFPIELPPLAEQELMANRFDALSEVTQRLTILYQRKLAALEELKKSLLHQAFTGQLGARAA